MGGEVYKTIYWRVQNFGPLEKKINEMSHMTALIFCLESLADCGAIRRSQREQGNFTQWRRHKSEFPKMVGEERAVWRKSQKYL